MNYYFELSEPIDGSNYVAMYGYGSNASLAERTTFLKMTIRSNRIWCEDNTGRVDLVKTCFFDLYNVHSHVDLKEFFWIKLKCKNL